MAITGIFSLDIISGKLFCPGYVVATWTDEQLKWNSSDFSGITRFSISSSDIWTPEFVQFGSTESQFTLKPAWVYENGTVIWIVGGLFEGLCNLDVLRYPLDEHVCEFRIQPKAYDRTEIEFKLFSDSDGLEFFTEHGEWEIISSVSSILKFYEPISMIEFVGLTRTLTVARRYLFVLIHTAIPLILTSILNVMVFLVPLRSGERITFSTAILLNFVFFTSNMSEDLPHNSLRISLCSIIMTITNITTTLGVIASVILCRMHHETIVPVPNSLKAFVTNFIACRIRRCTNVTKVETLNVIEGKDEDNISFIETASIKNKANDIAAQDITVTWSSVAESFDLIMFDMSLLFLIITCIVFSCLIMIK